MPVAVFLIIGSKEYKITQIIAGKVPIPRKGIANPNIAILGIA